MDAFRPTEEQRRILEHGLGSHARVLAGPGTGKSATLVALIEELLGRDPAPRIRLLTFTRAATGELAKKVSAHPAAERPSTIHSFAISVLVRHPGAGDLPEPLRLADPWEAHEVVRPTLARRAGVSKTRLDQLFKEMDANWESLSEDEDPRIPEAERSRFQAAWGEHRRVFGYTRLSELPFALRKALRAHPDLEGVDYDLMIVDEYQDLNACDLDVIKSIGARGCSVIGAGDDDQSIYSFRKAHPAGIRRFPSDYDGAADYALSVTQRCASRIIEWATHVIEGDLDRPSRPRLSPAPTSPPGEVALLSFAGQAAEPRGIAQLVSHLIEHERIPPSEILILLRTDHRGNFSKPIKRCLDSLSIPYSDPEGVKELLAEPGHRRLLEVCRLVADRNDSLAWGGLLALQDRIGETFIDYVYDEARRRRAGFGVTLLALHEEGFPAGPISSVAARSLIESVLAWLEANPIPDERSDGWGAWILGVAGDPIAPSPSPELEDLLTSLDDLVEPAMTLDRFLGQIFPLSKDRAANESTGVRIMTMATAKGLTVRATVIGAVEEGVVPRPKQPLDEERRLLYVAMTRAREFLYCTWARQRTGPTARAGHPRVQGRRSYCGFLEGGPVELQDGQEYLAR